MRCSPFWAAGLGHCFQGGILTSDPNRVTNVGMLPTERPQVDTRTPTMACGFLGHIVNPRKLEHGFRRISARIPYTLP